MLISLIDTTRCLCSPLPSDVPLPSSPGHIRDHVRARVRKTLARKPYQPCSALACLTLLILAKGLSS